MPVQNHDFPAGSPGQLLEPFAQVQFLRRKQFMAEAPNLTKGRGLDKNERTRQQPPPATGKIPQPGYQAGDQEIFVQPDSRTAGETAAGKNLFRHVRKKSGAGMGVGIHKDQPVPRSRGGAGVASAGNLIDGFKNHFGAGSASDIGRAVRGIIVADNELDRPAAPGKGGGGGLDFRERGTEELLLIEGGDDDGNFHPDKLIRNV